MYFRFESPIFLIFFLIIPVIVFFYLKNKNSLKLRFSSIDILPTASASLKIALRHLVFVLKIFAIILIIFSLARPQSGKKEQKILSEGIDIILILDTSGSMQALDFKENNKNVMRLDVVKKVISAFIKKRTNDRIGIIVFGTDAYTQCPLTLDTGILLQFIDRLKIGMAGDKTALGRALAMGVKRVKNLKAKSKLIILLTDGRNNEGRISPKIAAGIAASFDIKVYTIGVGTKGKAPFLVNSMFGKQYVYQKVDLDEDTLKEVAEITDGKYYRATKTKELENIYNEIDKLEKTKVQIKEYENFNDLFHYFLITGIAFLILSIILDKTIFRKIP